MTAPRGSKRANGEGTVYLDKARSKPGAKVWRAVVVGPDGRRRSERVTGSKADGFALRDRLRREVEATGTGPRRPPGGRQAWTVGTWLAYWRESVAGGRKGRHGTGLSKKTLGREAWGAGEITKELGSHSLRTLAAEDVEQFLAARARGIGCERRPWSEASCRDVRNLLARALDEAIERGHAPAPNKARAVKHMPAHAAPAEERFSLSAVEAQSLYHAARRRGDGPSLVVALQLATGLRPGEAMSLQWGRVDLSGAHTLRIDKAHAKTPNSIRTLHLPGPALVVLRDALRSVELRARDPLSYVFPGALRAAHVTERALIETLEDLCSDLAITVDTDTPRPPHPHEMRHTFASLLLDQDVPPQKVAGILGDDLATVLRTYAHRIRPVAGESEAVHVAALFGAAV